MSGERRRPTSPRYSAYDNASQTNTARLRSFQTLMLCRDHLAEFFYRKRRRQNIENPIESNLTFAHEHLSGLHCVKVVDTQVVWIESFNETLVRCQSGARKVA